jgi:diguanylate cyclase (GGDEF)-like protein/hemerythrin-like metal-binding protein/PAS domain S-box-containing protein
MRSESDPPVRQFYPGCPELLWELDADLRLTYVDSGRRERHFGGEAAIGQPLFELLTRASAIRLKRELARLKRASSAAAEAPLRCELELRRSDGGTLWVETHSMARRDESGAPAGFQGSARDITERKMHELALRDANRKLRRQLDAISALRDGLQERAERDFLTGLHNRRYFEETLPRELMRARREGYPLSLIMVDLDFFKKVNDSYGHATGDEALRMLAELLRRGARGSDILSRYGGEEFLIALPRMPLEQARQRAEAWRIELGATPVVHGRHRVYLTLSAGIAAYPDNGDALGTLIHMADAALYRAKRNGRNRVEHIEPPGRIAPQGDSIFAVRWKADYASGHPKIDEEHRRLFELASALLERVIDPAAVREARNTAFDAFLTHTLDHFAHEEAILRSVRLELASGHAEQHRRLLERALLLRRKVQDGEAAVGELVDFIGNDVIANHLLNVDRAFFPLFADQAQNG